MAENKIISKDDCRMFMWHNWLTDEFYGNIDSKAGIVNTKEQLIECVACTKYAKGCNKSEALFRILSLNNSK